MHNIVFHTDNSISFWDEEFGLADPQEILEDLIKGRIKICNRFMVEKVQDEKSGSISHVAELEYFTRSM